MKIIQRKIIEFSDCKSFFKYIKKFKMPKSRKTYKRGQYLLPADEHPYIIFLLVDMALDVILEEIRIPMNLAYKLKHRIEKFRSKK